MTVPEIVRRGKSSANEGVHPLNGAQALKTELKGEGRGTIPPRPARTGRHTQRAAPDPSQQSATPFILPVPGFVFFDLPFAMICLIYKGICDFFNGYD